MSISCLERKGTNIFVPFISEGTANSFMEVTRKNFSPKSEGLSTTFKIPMKYVFHTLQWVEYLVKSKEQHNSQ